MLCGGDLLLRVKRDFALEADSRADSSRRAVEAADNVVHAYDMNMGVPESPTSALDKKTVETILLQHEPSKLHPSSCHHEPHGTKRKRGDLAWNPRRGFVQAQNTAQHGRHTTAFEEPPAQRPKSDAFSDEDIAMETLTATCSHDACEVPCNGDTSTYPLFKSEHSVAPGLRHTVIREVIQYVIDEALKVGGRPDSAIAEKTPLGERIEVLKKGPGGQVDRKILEWMVTEDVPDSILIDEKDLAKTISCLILNAIKFTDNGNITVMATLSEHGRYIVITVKDTGSGIPAAFIPNLFTPFARSDMSITRTSEGLGLGLMVAKGLARRLNGDLFCVQSHVSGPKKGTEFELRVPHTPGDVCSRAGTPPGSRSPSLQSRTSADFELPPFQGAQLPPVTPPHSSAGFKREPLVTSSPLKNAPALHHLELHPTVPVSHPASPSHRSYGPSRSRKLSSDNQYDRDLASKYPLNFLVVEDNHVNQRVLINMLNKLGYKNIAQAYDGQNAIEQMRKERAPADQIDMVLMDLMMPLVDGFQATETIMKMDLPKHPIVIAVSADATDDARTRADEVGMRGYLLKPYKLHELEKYIVDSCTGRTW